MTTRCEPRTMMATLSAAALWAAAMVAAPPMAGEAAALSWQVPMTHETVDGIDHIQLRLHANGFFDQPAATGFFFVDDEDNFKPGGMNWETKFVNDLATFAVAQGPNLGAGTLAFSLNIVGDGSGLMPLLHYQAYRDGERVANFDFRAIGTGDEDWVREAGTWTQTAALWPDFIPGDANRDGAVDGLDLAIVMGNLGQAAPLGWQQGDFTGDGRTGLRDSSLLLGNWGDGATVPASAMSVPEPASGLLLLAGGMLGLCRRRRRGCATAGRAA